MLKQRLQVQCCNDVCEGHPRSLEMTTFDTMSTLQYNTLQYNTITLRYNNLQVGCAH